MKGVLRLDIEKHQTGCMDLENVSESGSVTNDSIDPGDHVTDLSFTKCPSNGSHKPQTSNSKWSFSDGKEVSGNGANASDPNADDVSWTKFFLFT